MVRCPSCGASSLFGVRTKQCAFCGKVVCNQCVPELIDPLSIKVAKEDERHEASYYTVGFCSSNCSHQFWQRVIDYQMNYEIGTDMENFNSNIVILWNNAIRDAVAQGASVMLKC